MTATPVEQDQVYAIAEEVFAAMVDGEPGHLRPWEGEVPAPAEPLVAWVEMHGDVAGGAAVSTDVPTAHDLTRALLGMGADEPVGPEDLVDAFGEVANVVGGNVKALLPHPGTLGLPHVAAALPDLTGSALSHALRLDWRGRPIVVVVWLS